LVGGDNGTGMVFKSTPGGAFTSLYSFCAPPCSDSLNPYDGLVQAINGDFYGTAGWGGTNGYGTVFKITPSGALTTLYSFCSQGVHPDCLDGRFPYAGLIQAANGDFYGTTQTAGSPALARCSR